MMFSTFFDCPNTMPQQSKIIVKILVKIAGYFPIITYKLATGSQERITSVNNLPPKRKNVQGIYYNQ